MEEFTQGAFLDNLICFIKIMLVLHEYFILENDYQIVFTIKLAEDIINI